jgi:hypothetical protein
VSSSGSGTSSEKRRSKVGAEMTRRKFQRVFSSRFGAWNKKVKSFFKVTAKQEEAFQVKDNHKKLNLKSILPDWYFDEDHNINFVKMIERTCSDTYSLMKSLNSNQ